MPGVNTLAWLIAILGMIMFVPWPVIGSLLSCSPFTYAAGGETISASGARC